MPSFKFIKAFFKNWREVGALAPTSRFVARRMVKNIDFDSARLIVEFGAGTGDPITRELLGRMRPDAELVAFEVNPGFCEELRAMGDSRLTVVNDSALALGSALGGRTPDHIVSSIPLTTLPGAVTREILRVSRERLGDNGLFVQVQYSPKSYRVIKEHFGNVSKAVEGLNLPPALIYECRP